ncbi:hypothetical protein V8C34DRAFT_55970 [Trichoderma compactum]
MLVRMGCKQSCGCHGNGPKREVPGCIRLSIGTWGSNPWRRWPSKRFVACDAKVNVAVGGVFSFVFFVFGAAGV